MVICYYIKFMDEILDDIDYDEDIEDVLTPEEREEILD